MNNNISLDRLFLLVIGCISLIYFSLFFYFLESTIVREPFADMIVFITRYFDLREHGDWLRFLWTPHAWHRPIWTRLLTAADIWLFSGAIYPFIVFNTACLIAIPLMLWREIAFAGLPRDLMITAGLLVTMLFLTTANVVDCSIPIEGVYPHTLFFSVASIVLLAGSGADIRSHGWKRVAALLAAVCAAFGSLVGLIVWPILIWMSWRMRTGLRWLLIVFGFGVLFCWTYANGLTVPQSASHAVDLDSGYYTAAHLLKVGDYFITYMGLPWTRAAALADVGRVIGAALSATGIALVVMRTFDKFHISRLDLISLGLIMFSLTTGVLAAVGRVDDLPYVAVPVRYSVYLAPLHAGLLFLALPLVQRFWQAAGARRNVQMAIVTAVMILVVQQFFAGQAAIAGSKYISDTIHRFIAGERTPEMTRLVFDDLAHAEYLYGVLRRDGIYLDPKKETE
ncbi:MAG: hypothetical protein EXQ84_00105 [Rhodospirillaceae bacterium]|nr:hypothetical protein [Rhodospirillaceae bacterium]